MIVLSRCVSLAVFKLTVPLSRAFDRPGRVRLGRSRCLLALWTGPALVRSPRCFRSGWFLCEWHWRSNIEAFGVLPHDAPADESLQRTEREAIVRRDETDGVADCVRPAGAADPMHVILGVHGEVVVHHVRYAIHVDAARRDVGGHEHTDMSGLEILQRAQALVLGTVGVQRGGANAALFELSGHPVGAVLRPRKDQHHVHARIEQQVQKQSRLGMVANFVNELRDGFGRVRAPADLDHLRRAQEFVRKPLDLARQRGRKQQGLALMRKGPHNAADVWQKAHVEHPVSFIENEKFQPGEISEPLAHKIQQATGRGDHDVGTVAQGVLLGDFADAAEDGGNAQAKVACVDPYIFFNLDDEFASRRDNEHAGATGRRWRIRFRFQPGQYRQGKGGGLAGACLSNANQVMASEDQRDGRGLDWRRFSVAGFPDCFLNVGPEAKCAK